MPAKINLRLIWVCVWLGAILAACRPQAGGPAPAAPTPGPTGTPLAAEVTPSWTADAAQTLAGAVETLSNATSFTMNGHSTRAYQIFVADGTTRRVYGEFIDRCDVIRLPALKVHCNHQYRFAPGDDFIQSDSYAYQQDGTYYTRQVEAGVAAPAQETSLDAIEPFANDVYATLMTYAGAAKFVGASDGVAVYRLEHPVWYQLNSAIGFADLGFLAMQADGEQLIQSYVAEHYPGVKTVLFTLFVDVHQNVVTRVEVDDREFMTSLWAEVHRALLEQGATTETLSRYEVLEENGSEFSFEDYNQVQDFAIP